MPGCTQRMESGPQRVGEEEDGCDGKVFKLRGRDAAASRGEVGADRADEQRRLRLFHISSFGCVSN